MNQRLFCIASLVLVTFALCLDFGAKNRFSKYMHLRANSLSVATEQKGQMIAEAHRASSMGSILVILGLVFAVSSLVCLVVSFRRHEAVWWRAAPVALLIWYLMMQFTLV